jgi:putative membrane protein
MVSIFIVFRVYTTPYGIHDGWHVGRGLWLRPRFPVLRLVIMLAWIVLFLVIGYFVYLDANKRGMNGIQWWILVIIPMIGIIALILYIILRETGTQKSMSEGKTAIDILKERYAKGEITSEQFQKMCEELKK